MKTAFLSFLLLMITFPCIAATQSTGILFDVSRSVPYDDFEKAKSVIAKLLSQAKPGDTVLIYAFGDSLRRIQPEELGTIKASDSNTLLYDSAYDVARELQKTGAERKALLIISDGLDTKSVTILEDTISFANENGISIHSIGVGNVNRKSLERIAKLTDGVVFGLNDPNLAAQIRETLDRQRAVSASLAPAPEPQAIAPVVPEKEDQAKSESIPVSQPSPPDGFLQRHWLLLSILTVVLFLPAALFLIVRALRSDTRLCPVCGRALEPYQTFCPDCSTRPVKTTEHPGEKTVEIENRMDPVARVADPVPQELLIKKPVSEELLTKTFVLLEKPVLVVRKGKNTGQTFTLNKSFPVSIGRSRVNEIKLEDVAVSGQHCRIIPENGRHVCYDLGSTNGTYVNEKRIQKAVLQEGDILKIGETQFLYKVEQQRN